MANKSIILILAFLLSISIASALPDLIIEDIKFYKGGMLIVPDENGTHFRTGDRFFAKPILKNIGNTTSEGFHFTTYMNGEWYSLITVGGLAPNQTHNPEYVPSGSSMPFSDGNHNVTMIVNELNFTEDYLYHPTINESNYTNNIYTEILYSDNQPTNNPPEITFVEMDNLTFDDESLVMEFGVHDPNGEFDIAEFGIKFDNETISTGETYYEFETNSSHEGFHNVTFYVYDHTAGAYDEEIREIEVRHILENDEVDDIAIPIYLEFDINDTGEFYLDSPFFVSPDVFINADRGNANRLPAFGDEYMDNQGELTNEEIDKCKELVYGILSQPTYRCAASEYLFAINPTTAKGYNYTMYNNFCYAKNICGVSLPANSACNNQYPPLIYQQGPGENPSILNTSSQIFSIIARDTNDDEINITWYLDDEIVETDFFSAGSKGGKAEYTLVGNESLIGQHTVRVEVEDSYFTEHQDPINYNKHHEWNITVT